MLTEKNIIHEQGEYWVLEEKGVFHVMKSGFTHSTSDSSFDKPCLAIARCKYIGRLFNVYALPTKGGPKVKLSSQPMNHPQACSFKNSFIQRDCRTIELEQIDFSPT